MTVIRSYQHLHRFESFEDRFEYLRLNSQVGRATFGWERYVNQTFYRSAEWKRIRQHVIARDDGMDLGVQGYPIYDKIIIHHMNPISSDDITHRNEYILDPEFLITTTLRTHNAIHYGDKSQLLQELKERRPGDTKLW